MRNQPIAPTAAPVASAPSLRPITLAQQAADDRHADEEEEREVLPVEAARRRPTLCALRARRRQLLAGDQAGDAIDGCVQPAREVAVLERREHLLANDAAGGDVGDRTLERRRDLDVDVVIVLRDRDQQAVADLLAAELPVRRDALRERRDVFRSRRRPIRITTCAPRSFSSAASFALRASACAAVSVAVWSITRPVSTGTGTTLGASRRREQQRQQQRQGGGETGAHQAAGAERGVQREAGLSKLTGGGTESAPRSAR